MKLNVAAIVLCILLGAGLGWLLHRAKDDAEPKPPQPSSLVSDEQVLHLERRVLAIEARNKAIDALLAKHNRTFGSLVFFLQGLTDEKRGGRLSELQDSINLFGRDPNLPEVLIDKRARAESAK